MSGPTNADRKAAAARSWRNVAVLVALMALSNVMTNRVLPGALYVPWQLGIAAVLVWVAVHVDGRHPFELGLDRRNLGSGLRWGGGILLAIAALFALAALLPSTRGLFEDDRVGRVALVGMLYQVLVRIPLGTVVLEEVAFRGALLAMLLHRTTLWRAVFWSSLLFGLWHVLPSIGIERVNPVLDHLLGGTGGRVLAVVGAVVATGAAGYVFCFLRLRSESLLAPVLLHVATNSVGFVTAWIVLRAR